MTEGIRINPATPATTADGVTLQAIQYGRRVWIAPLGTHPDDRGWILLGNIEQVSDIPALTIAELALLAARSDVSQWGR